MTEESGHEMKERDPFRGTQAAIGRFVDILGENIDAVLREKDAEIERLQAKLAECGAVLKHADYPVHMVMSVTLREKARQLLKKI